MKKAVVFAVSLALILSFLDLFEPRACGDLPFRVSLTDEPRVLEQLDVSVSAKYAVLMTVDGELLFSKGPDERAEPASTTKIMTALLALENLRPDAEVCIPAAATGIEGSSLYLKAGEILTVRELVLGMMLESGNDAAAAIAIACAGSVEEFTAMMNERARRIGMTNTHFDNPHGLSSENHYTTARDLALLAAEAMKNDEFAQAAGLYKSTITGYGSDRGRILINHNKLLKLYPGAVGVKTGFTKSSGRTLVGAAERDGLTLISVTLNAPDDWNDHISLFDAGFASYRRECVCNEGEISLCVKVAGGTKDSVEVTNAGDVYVTLGADETLTKRYILPDFVYAPVRRGDYIGEIALYGADGRIGSVLLTASEDVGRESINFWEKIFGK